MYKHKHREAHTIQVPARQQHAGRLRVRGPLAVLVTLMVTVIVVNSSRAVTAHPTALPAVSASSGSAPLEAKPKPDQNMCAPRLPWDTVRQQAARELHLTVAQVRARILGGAPIQVVAAAQHISLGRLHTIELHALQVGNERWIRLGCNTRQEGATYMGIYSRMTLAQLNQEFTNLFVES